MDPKHEPGDLTEEVGSRDTRDTTEQVDSRDPHDATEQACGPGKRAECDEGQDPRELVEDPDSDVGQRG